MSVEWVPSCVESDGGRIRLPMDKRWRYLSQKVMPLDHAASKVFWCKIFIEDNWRLLCLLHMVNFMCEMLLTVMTPVVQKWDVPDAINKKSPGSGQNIKKTWVMNEYPSVFSSVQTTAVQKKECLWQIIRRMAKEEAKELFPELSAD